MVRKTYKFKLYNNDQGRSQGSKRGQAAGRQGLILQVGIQPASRSPISSLGVGDSSFKVLGNDSLGVIAACNVRGRPFADGIVYIVVQTGLRRILIGSCIRV